MAHYYVDFDKGSHGDGLSPATAWNRLGDLSGTTFPNDPVNYIWIRRTATISTDFYTSIPSPTYAWGMYAQNSYMRAPTTLDHARHMDVVSRWPTDADITYDDRPALARSIANGGGGTGWEDWDGDPDVKPHLHINDTTRTRLSGVGTMGAPHLGAVGIQQTMGVSVGDAGYTSSSTAHFLSAWGSNPGAPYSFWNASECYQNCEMTAYRDDAYTDVYSSPIGDIVVRENVQINGNAKAGMWNAAFKFSARPSISVGCGWSERDNAVFCTAGSFHIASKFTDHKTYTDWGPNLPYFSSGQWDVWEGFARRNVGVATALVDDQAVTHDYTDPLQFKDARYYGSPEFMGRYYSSNGWPPGEGEPVFNFAHYGANDLDAAVRNLNVGAIYHTTTNMRPGSSAAHNVVFKCNKHAWVGAWDSVGYFPGSCDQLRTGTSVYPLAGSHVYPPTMEDAWTFGMPSSDPVTVTFYAKVSGIDAGTYGGTFPSHQMIYFIVWYPSGTKYSYVRSSESFLVDAPSNDTWLGFTCTFTPTPGQCFAYMGLQQTLDYPNRVRANINLSMPDWFVQVDPVPEIT